MADVSIRELRNRGGDVVDRAARGEQVTITRDGKPVAELRAAPRPALAADALVARWRQVPEVDGALFRRELDALLDPRL